MVQNHRMNFTSPDSTSHAAAGYGEPSTANEFGGAASGRAAPSHRNGNFIGAKISSTQKRGLCQLVKRILQTGVYATTSDVVRVAIRRLLDEPVGTQTLEAVHPEPVDQHVGVWIPDDDNARLNRMIGDLMEDARVGRSLLIRLATQRLLDDPRNLEVCADLIQRDRTTHSLKRTTGSINGPPL